MSMFMGEFNHTIDAKGRLIIPSRFREELGQEFVMTKGLDGCLFVFPQNEWESFQGKLKILPLINKDFLDFLWREQLRVRWTSREEPWSQRHFGNLLR